MSDQAPLKQNDLFAPEQTAIVGAIDRVTFHNEENGWTVARFMQEDDDEPIYAVGTMLGPVAGESYRLRGKWVDDPKYGRQFKFEQATVHVPTTLDGLARFLGGGMIKGLGPKTAERIVETFGEKTIEILDSAPSRLREIKGLGRKTISLISEGWAAKRHAQEAMSFLQGHGITPRLADKIYRRYGDRTIDIVQGNPYRLARDIDRVGFKKADAIAMRMGLPKNSPERAEAAILYLLAQGSSAGHCFLTFEELQRQGAEMLEGDEKLVQRSVKALHKDLYVRCEVVRDARGDERNAVYPTGLRDEEDQVARLLRGLAQAPKMLPKIDFSSAIDDFEEKHHFKFAGQQREAVENALRGGVVVITGGPGTGKTTIVRAILRILKEHGGHAVLAAPTGRAARRLSESAKARAQTIHRLLNFDPSTNSFLYGVGNPLKADLVVVDEASMIDIQLAAKLLSAIPSSAGALFVGDIDQLPSVGPGEFLRDLIDSGAARVTRLDEVFRQKQASLIVRNAHRVNHGEFPYLSDDDDPDAPPPEDPPPGKKKRRQDFFFIEKDDPDELKAALAKVLKERLPQAFGFDPIEDAQVLVPMHKNTLGAAALNELLQATLNDKNEPEYIRAGVELRVGDKLMQTRNNYELEVFNGDIGRVQSIDRTKRVVHIDFDGRLKAYPFEDLDQLTLAYAISIHKSQGSEYRCAIVVFHTQHHVMLQRNLLYTALTRAKELAVVIGSRKAVAVAIKQAATRERNTALAWRIRRLVNEEASASDEEPVEPRRAPRLPEEDIPDPGDDE